MLSSMFTGPFAVIDGDSPVVLIDAPAPTFGRCVIDGKAYDCIRINGRRVWWRDYKQYDGRLFSVFEWRE